MFPRPMIVIALLAAVLTAVPAAAQDPGEAIQDAVRSLRGDEIQFEVPVDLGAFGSFTLYVDGFAFCIPSDPTAEPAADPTPPHNIYGCENTVTADLQPAGPVDEWTLVLGVPAMFFDCRTARSGADGEGYVTGSAELTATVRSTDMGDCDRFELVPGSTAVEVSDLDGVFTDSLVDLGWNLLEGVIYEEVANQSAEFEASLALILEVVNDELCPDVAREASGFGELKARFR